MLARTTVGCGLGSVVAGLLLAAAWWRRPWWRALRLQHAGWGAVDVLVGVVAGRLQDRRMQRHLDPHDAHYALAYAAERPLARPPDGILGGVLVAAVRRWVVTLSPANLQGDAVIESEQATRRVPTGAKSVVGRVAEVWRYPVKSMAGERVAVADLSWQGLSGDRRWAFVRPGRAHTGFPWLTIRQQPMLHHYRPTVLDPDRPDRSAVRVTDPEERVYR